MTARQLTRRPHDGCGAPARTDRRSRRCPPGTASHLAVRCTVAGERSDSMPPTAVHFNGGVNLSDAETVFREISARVPFGVRRIPDGETGDRANWIFFQLQKFWQTPGLEQAAPRDLDAPGYEQMPKVRLADGVAPESIAWPNLGYADAYLASFQIYRRLQDEGVIPVGVRFQLEYPTPLASINAWVVDEDQNALEASYEDALLADLDRLLSRIRSEERRVGK